MILLFLDVIILQIIQDIVQMDVKILIIINIEMLVLKIVNIQDQ